MIGGILANVTYLIFVNAPGGLCTGTVIAPTFILTNRICGEDPDGEPSVAERVRLIYKKAWYVAAAIHLPRKRDTPIAVLEMNETNPVPWTPIGNIGGGFVDCQVYSFNGDDMYRAPLTLRACTADTICAIYNWSVPCLGDAGGPLICNGTLRAILSAWDNMWLAFMECSDKDVNGEFFDILIEQKWLRNLTALPVFVPSPSFAVTNRFHVISVFSLLNIYMHMF